MWAIDQRPFEIPVGGVPLGGWHDYPYKIMREDPRMTGLKFIDWDSVHFVEPINPGRGRPPERMHGEHVPLGGQAWRTLWERRDEIPEIVWQLTYCEGLGFSQFYLDGMEIFNPYGVDCWAYLRRYKGQVYWGFTAAEYNWGYFIPAIVMRPSRALWGP